MTKRRAGAVVLAISVLGACATEATNQTRAADTTTTTDTSPPAVEEPSSTTTQSEVAPIGPNGWFTWEDGVKAQVTSIARFTPEFDESPGVPDVVATITVKNGTNSVLDLLEATAILYAGPNGVQAEEEFSYYGFDGSVPPGSSATAKWSWSVPADHLGALRVEFTPGFDYDPAFFQGSAA